SSRAPRSSGRTSRAPHTDGPPTLPATTHPLREPPRLVPGPSHAPRSPSAGGMVGLGGTSAPHLPGRGTHECP
ncbi:unnamed protein product, partial [Closterium sp. Naga37s-1]